MITPTNQAKNNITPKVSKKTGFVLWGDTDYTWGDSFAQWGGPLSLAQSNQAKHAITPVNQAKS